MCILGWGAAKMARLRVSRYGQDQEQAEEFEERDEQAGLEKAEDGKQDDTADQPADPAPQEVGPVEGADGAADVGLRP